MKPNRLRPLSMAVTIFVACNARAAVEHKGDEPVLKETRAQRQLLSTPLHFEKNSGQTDSAVKYLSRGKGYALFLTANEAVLRLSSPPARGQVTSVPASVPSRAGSNLQTLPASVLRMRLIGANSEPEIIGLATFAGKVNYFKGSDPAQWRTDVPTYGQVEYQHIYPGIDLLFYGNSQQELEYDFVIAPGADPDQIKLGFTGADNIEIADDGDLVLRMGDRKIRQRKPRIYQLVNGREQEIAGSYAVLQGGGPDASEWLVAFSFSNHDTNLLLIIDPVLSYSTCLGGIGTDAATGVAVDAQGHAYLAGWTDSPDFPAVGVVGATARSGGRDAFVAKLNADGGGFVYSTFVGGFDGAGCHGIAVDSDGNAYLTGLTGDGFPVVNGCQASVGGWIDAFVMKLNSNGNAIVYSTYLGGTGADNGFGIAVNGSGKAFVTGITSSTNFPIASALQPAFGGGGPNNPNNDKGDAFLAKIDTTATGTASLVYSTYLGGNDDDAPKDVAVDAAGNAFAFGYTASTNFPTTLAAFQPAYGGGDYDAFVVKLNPAGAALVYSTFLGGTNRDNDANGGGGIAVDAAGNAFVTGQTVSDDFPTKNAWRPRKTGFAQGFVSKVNSDGSDLIFSTYLQGVPYTAGIAVDQANSAYVVGHADGDFPTVNAVQSVYGGGGGNEWDGFLLKMDPDGQSALYATFLGGTNGEWCLGIAVGPDGSAYVTGYTTSTNFPARNALQPAFGGGPADAFLTKVSDLDTNPPVILAASNYGDSNVVTIDFSEALDVASATNATHYALDHGITVDSATMGVNSKTVRLMTSGLTNGATYTLTVNDVLDRAPVPNPIAPDTHATITALGLYRGFLHQEVYAGIDSSSLADLTNNAKFPDHPDATNDVHLFEVLQNAGSQSGTRLSGYLLPPVTGDYTFYIAAAQQGALFLSKNESPLNAVQIALEPSSTEPRAWIHYPPGFPTNALPNISLPVHLEAGKAYYVEALAQSLGGNILGVNWQVPSQAVPLNTDPPISGNHLAMLGNPQNATLAIVQQPQDVTLAEGQTADFNLKAIALPAGIFYQWRKNGLEIPGANGPSFITSETILAGSGVLYDCVLTIPGATATSRSALLTVTNDVTPPALVSAEGNLTLTNLTLIFSEPINLADATNTANYVLSGGLTLSSAVLLADRRTVVLSTGPQNPGSNYLVQVSGIRDRATAGNSVTAGSQVPFIAWVDEQFVGPFPSWANVKTDYGAAGNGVADDTAALQQALNEVATPDHAAVLYFPTGTYRITQTLNFNSRLNASLVGEEPLTTIIKWDGATNADMMFANSVAYSRWTRLTWDGSGKARLAVHHGYTSGPYQVTGNLHTDEIFKDVGTGLAADPANGGDSHTIIRCHFLRCFDQGIAVGSYNVIDWHVWDSLFEDCQYGLRAYAGNFHVYRCLFLRSTVVDVHCSDGGSYYGIRGNTSIGSKAFVEGYAMKTIQGNTVIDSLDPSPVQIIGSAPTIFLDNTIRSRSDAPGGPVVDVDVNLLSVGNTFTAERPIAVAGRSITMGDQVVSRDSLSLPPIMIPRFLPKSASPVIEVPTNANAATIQQAIDTAATLNGSRPIVHLPAGNYYLDRTLVVPANCDLQLAGDGLAATTLGDNGALGAVAIRLVGPSRATLRDFHVAGLRNGTGIALENCDQPQARVFLERVYLSYSGFNNLVVDRLDDTDVSMNDLFHGGADQVSLRVIGGARQAAGQSTSGRVVVFGGGTGGGNLTYQVEHGGRLMAQDIWFEGTPRFMRLADSGTFTLNNAQIAAFDISHTVGGNGAVELDDFHGQVTFLTTAFSETSALVKGDGSATDLLLLGCLGFPDNTPPKPETYLDNQSPNARIAHLLSSSSGLDIPNVGEDDPIFLRKMLSQVRTETPRRLVPLPGGVTDVRIYGVSVEACKIAMILSGSNALPQLPPLSTQFVNEGSPLAVTNTVIGPDAPFGLYYFALGPGFPNGMAIDPATGILTWTPTEAQGPSTNQISVIATSLASPVLSATNVLTIVVTEINSPPVLLLDRTLVGLDIGTPGDPVEAGATTILPDGSIEVLASGSDIQNTDDHFHYSCEQVDGDFDVIVQVADLQQVNHGTEAGIMLRESLDSNSRHVTIVTTPPPPIGADDIRAIYRGATGVSLSDWPGQSHSGGINFPNCWLRLQREVNTFKAFRSADGIAWQQFSENVLAEPFPQRAYLGLCTTANTFAPGQRTRALYRTFQNYPSQFSNALVDRTVNEGDVIRFQALVRDSDVPTQSLTFGLDSGAPSSASIDPTTGVFTWTPSEAQGPGVYPITVSVTDNGTPLLTNSRTFMVTVNESNDAPVLGALIDYKINAGQTVSFTTTAADADMPTNTLSFSLPSPPAGATITSGGSFNWRPGVALANTTNVLQVLVQDNGAPVSNDTRSFSVIVNPLAAPVVLTPLGFANGQFTLGVTGPLGPDYVVMASTNLAQWSDLLTNLSPTLPFQHTDTNSTWFSNRLYRVRLSP